jgi:uncharacterized membrane protein SirB2
MTGYYLPLRAVHITCAALTILMFAVRGVMMLLDSQHLRHPLVRWPPVVVDTVLLTTAFMLTTIVHQYPLTDGWLTMKLVLLVAYVGLGTIALRPARPKAIRAAAFMAALATVGFLVSVARAHQPLGFLAR